jgi:hypothetical protein
MSAMKKSNQPNVCYGVAVYLPDQWERLLATAEDAEKHEVTWEAWRQVLDESERNMRSIGIEPIEVVLDLDEFEKYLEKKHLKNNGGARAGYVAEMLQRQAKNRDSDPIRDS